MKYRRLTRDEAARRGVSYTAKNMVPAATKRVTKATPLLSNRQATQTQLRAERVKGAKGSKAKAKARRFTKENLSAARKVKTTLKDGRSETKYFDLAPRELPRILRAAKGRGVVLLIYAEFGGGGNSGAAGGLGWRHGIAEADADDLLDPEALKKYLKASGALSKPTRYGVVVR